LTFSLVGTDGMVSPFPMIADGLMIGITIDLA
jgi:hypothetical protein